MENELCALTRRRSGSEERGASAADYLILEALSPAATATAATTAAAAATVATLVSSHTTSGTHRDGGFARINVYRKCPLDELSTSAKSTVTPTGKEM